VFVLVVAMFAFLPYFGNYAVLVFVGLFGFSYLTRPRTRQGSGRQTNS
jgi:hypothetical protein